MSELKVTNLPERLQQEIFLKIADNNFRVFCVCSEQDVDLLRSTYKDKEYLREQIKNLLLYGVDTLTLNQITKVEIFSLLIEFLFENCEDIHNLEICTIFLIFSNTFDNSFKIFSKKQIFEFFKKDVIRHSVDRPPFQIGILRKKTIEKLSEFYINTIYTRFELMKYLMTNHEQIEITNKNMFSSSLPPILDISMGFKKFPRQFKILKQYMENRKPKSEIEQKIEIILDFERDKLDQLLEERFHQQDQAFNKKLEELLSKKKK